MTTSRLTESELVYAAARDVVFARDGYVCQRCGERRGRTTHHRHPRGMGGSSRRPEIHGYANLVTVDDICHDGAESERTVARDTGWLVPDLDAVARTPILFPSGWWLLTDSGVAVKVCPRVEAWTIESAVEVALSRSLL